MPNKKMVLFNIEFSRLDENQVLAYQVAVDTDSDADQLVAIKKAEEEFANDRPGADLVPHSTITDPKKRQVLNRATTWWRNKVNKSNDILI